MGDKTNIGWTDATWNPVVGCNQVSPGCAHCYAKTLHDLRHKAYLAGKQVPKQYALPFESVQLIHERVSLPLHWRTPRRIFVNSVSDLFHEDVPFDFIDKVFAVMALTPQHTYQILTKRPERMLSYMRGDMTEIGQTDRVTRVAQLVDLVPTELRQRWPLPNVWLGTSVENQHWVDIRVPILLKVPATIRFLSCEPLLGHLNLRGKLRTGHMIGRISAWGDETYHDGPGIDWVIIGGESGKGYRAMDPDWARSLVMQCREANVAVYFKQHSALRSESNCLLDGREYKQYPGEAA